MYFLDVNVCVHAIRPDEGQQAQQVRDWLDARLTGPETLGVCEFVLAAMTRIVTQPRLFREPSTPEQCMQFADALIGAPTARVVRPGPRHWPIFRDLVTTQRLRGNAVPDAYLAALAIEQGAALATRDRGFARFNGLRTHDPLG